MPMSWKQRQPAHDHVGVEVEVRADEHRLGVGDDVGVGDLHGLGRAGRARRQLHQRDVVVVGVDRVDRALFASKSSIDRAPACPARSSSGAAGMNGSETTTAFGVDHLDHGGGLLGPARQVGAGRGLVQHGQRWRRASRCPGRSGRSRPGRRPAPRRRHRARCRPRPVHRRPDGPARAPRPRYAGPARPAPR